MNHQQLIDEIRDVLRRHNVALCGSCYDEGIHGEIEIIDLSSIDEPDAKYCDNEIRFMPTIGGSAYVQGIKP